MAAADPNRGLQHAASRRVLSRNEHEFSSLLAGLRAISPTALQTKNYRLKMIAGRRTSTLSPNLI
jgi:hypothetical protein